MKSIERVGCSAVLLVASSAAAQPWCPDTNLSGTVNFADLTAIVSNFCSTGPLGDAWRDMSVNVFDFVPPAVSFNAAVPPGGCLPTPLGSLVGEFMLGSVGTDICNPGLEITTANGGSFFRDAGVAGLGRPTSAQVCAVANRAFHTYVAMGGPPATCGGPSPGAPTAVGSITGGTLRVDWTLDLAALTQGTPLPQSTLAPINFGTEAVFIARLTTPRNDRLRRCRMLVFLQDSLGWHRMRLLLDGPPVNVDLDGNPTTRPMGIRTIRVAQPNIAGFGDADVYDVYVVSGAFGGDNNGDFCISFNDVTQVLVNWLNDYRPCTGPGDADGDGIVTFADVTYTLLFWVSPYVCL